MFACFGPKKQQCKTLKQIQYEKLSPYQRNMYNHNFSNNERKTFHRVLNNGTVYTSNAAYNYVMKWRPRSNKGNNVISGKYYHNNR